MSKIYELPLSYRIARKYVIWSFKQFYSEYIILGKENIPDKGPVLFAPNHLNALMDALAVLSLPRKKSATVFLARADIFKNKTIARLLRFTKIMPAFRIRDGVENLGKNAEVFDLSTEVLEKDNAMCIMPEGNQELERKVRPLVKGIFRIAFSAQEKIGNQDNVKIVPIGIDLGHLEKSQQHIIINIGKPINVADYMTEYSENQATAINKLKDKLRESLENLTLNLNSDRYYKTFETATRLCNYDVLNTMGLKKNTVNLFYARLKTGKKLLKLEKDNPEKTEELHQNVLQFEKIRTQIGLPFKSFTATRRSTLNLIASTLILILFLPVFLIGLTFNFLPFFLPVWIRKAMKVEFTGFYSSIQYGAGIITSPVFYLIQAILLTTFTDSNWYWLLVIIPFEFIFGKLSIKIYKNFRKLYGYFQRVFIMTKREKEFMELEKLKNRITEAIQ
ncbi:MAG: 1-acyl-sn-glycerol-3-phosphate acyltransferase [Paludibacter sp.]|nr:1-acyl-sn-glycerol-3-phosphate acyltransferase [Paludibacter sp.]